MYIGRLVDKEMIDNLSILTISNFNVYKNINFLKNTRIYPSWKIFYNFWCANVNRVDSYSMCEYKIHSTLHRKGNYFVSKTWKPLENYSEYKGKFIIDPFGKVYMEIWRTEK